MHIWRRSLHLMQLSSAVATATVGPCIQRRVITYCTAGADALNAPGTPAAAAASAAPSSDHAGKCRKPQRELVDQFLIAVNSSRRQQLQQRKVELMQHFHRAAGDVGSPEVQIALLTDKIRDMAEHFQKHRKDFHSRRGLQGMLNQRRKLLGYLRRSSFPRYAFVLHKLGLKDTYAKQERYDKYRIGTRLGAPAEPLRRYGNR